MTKKIVTTSKVLVLSLFIFLFTTGCKSKKTGIEVSTPETVKLVEPTNKAKEIIVKHYSRNNNFKSALIKADVSYSDGKQSQNLTAEIKVYKGQKILVSLRFFGITMAKALITPNSVGYYEKIKGTYFDGDFALLTNLLGTDMDYLKIENLILGEAIDDLTKQNYICSLEEQLYRLDFKENSTTKTFFIESDHYMVKKLEIAQDKPQRQIQVKYANFKVLNDIMFPFNVLINVLQQSKTTEISLDYNTITLDEEFSFPYSVPNGYKKILIN